MILSDIRKPPEHVFLSGKRLTEQVELQFLEPVSQLVCVFIFYLFVFLGLQSRHMEVPRLGVQLEL